MLTRCARYLEMAEMVRGERELDAVRALSARGNHDARVAYDRAQRRQVRRELALPLIAERMNRGKRAHVERAEYEPRRCVFVILVRVHVRCFVLAERARYVINRRIRARG